MERSVNNLPLQDNRKTQAERIEDLLRSRYAQWVPVYELADIALLYNTRIFELREKLRENGNTEEIENRKERVRGQVHSSFRICPIVPISSFSAEKPAKSWEQICAERDAKMSQPGPSFELTP
jgi:hypothetical protein